MNKNNDKITENQDIGVSQTEYQVKLDFVSSVEGIPVRHCNQALIQVHEQEMLLSFFMVVPPMIVGQPAEMLEQLKSITKITPDCVARINMSPRVFKKFVEIMQQKLKEYEEQEAKEDGK